MEEKILKTLLEKIDALDKKIDTLVKKSKSGMVSVKYSEEKILTYVADLDRPRSKTWIARESGIQGAKHVLADLLDQGRLSAQCYAYHTDKAGSPIRRSFDAITLPGVSILRDNVASLRAAKLAGVPSKSLAKWSSEAHAALAEDDKRRVDATRKAMGIVDATRKDLGMSPMS